MLSHRISCFLQSWILDHHMSHSLRTSTKKKERYRIVLYCIVCRWVKLFEFLGSKTTGN